MSSILRNLGFAVVVIVFPGIASAHRLDEYLQATRISVELDGIKTEIDLTPGAALADDGIAGIDRDHNGDISKSEGATYARSVVESLSVEIDGQRHPLNLDTFSIPSIADMRRGEGVIRLRAAATIASASAGRHHLRFANGHRRDIGVYMVNALVPARERIRITGMSRDMLQREFDLDYSISPAKRGVEMAAVWPMLLGLALAAAVFAFARR